MLIEVSKESYLYAGCILSENRMVILSRQNYESKNAMCVAFFCDEKNIYKLNLPEDFFIGAVEIENRIVFASQFGNTKMVDWRINTPWNNILASCINQSIKDTNDFGEITKIRAFDSTFWLCGQFGQLYSFSNNNWSRADHGLRSLAAPSFEDIAGKSKANIVGCGLFGELNQFNGVNWKKIQSPTNRNISAIICSDSGKYFAAGYNGIVLVGEGKEWSIIGEPISNRNYEDLAFHEGELFLLYPTGIDRVSFDSIIPVEDSFDAGVTFRKFAWGHDRLIVVCQDRLYEHDKGKWHLFS